MTETLLDTKQLADLLGVTPRTPERWRRERVGPPWIKAGKRVLYRKADIDQWLESRKQEPVREKEMTG